MTNGAKTCHIDTKLYNDGLLVIWKLNYWIICTSESVLPAVAVFKEQMYVYWHADAHITTCLIFTSVFKKFKDRLKWISNYTLYIYLNFLWLCYLRLHRTPWNNEQSIVHNYSFILWMFITWYKASLVYLVDCSLGYKTIYIYIHCFIFSPKHVAVNYLKLYLIQFVLDSIITLCTEEYIQQKIWKQFYNADCLWVLNSVYISCIKFLWVRCLLFEFPYFWWHIWHFGNCHLPNHFYYFTFNEMLLNNSTPSLLH